jgi:hypothetical protein
MAPRPNFVQPLEDYYALLAKTYPVAASDAGGDESLHQTYSRNGHLGYRVSETIAADLLGFFARELACEFRQDDYQPDYYSPAHAADTTVRLNRNNQYYAPPPKGPAASALMALLTEMRPVVEEAIGHPFQVVNVRAWTTPPHSEAFGPSGWHTDGASHFVRKIMIYPRPLNPDNGSLELEGHDGERLLLNSPFPLAVLADVGDLKHRGVPPQVSDPELGGRPAIEVTLVPAAATRLDLTFHGHNAHVPVADLERWRQMLRNQTRAITRPSAPDEACPHQVNIGGGMGFSYPDWVNFDAASPNYSHRLRFDPQTRLPYPDGHATLVYSSHCLEHLDDPTVVQLLSEAVRIVAENGDVVIKLPDFDAVLDHWSRRDGSGILEPGQWGLPGLFNIWNANPCGTGLEACTAMIFCGFWNSAYGDEFSGGVVRLEGAYHGPPRVSPQVLTQILDSSTSPHMIAALLKSQVIRSEPDYCFNHQNAWSRAEFVQMAKAAGLELVVSGAEVLTRFAGLPTLEDMAPISSYFHFKKSL